jgi:hypothetical protein
VGVDNGLTSGFEIQLFKDGSRIGEGRAYLEPFGQLLEKIKVEWRCVDQSDREGGAEIAADQAVAASFGHYTANFLFLPLSLSLDHLEISGLACAPSIYRIPSIQFNVLFFRTLVQGHERKA